MKTRLFRSITLLIVLSMLTLSLTGCDMLDYRRAFKLYNAGNFEAAAEYFSALGDYEDCPELHMLSRYWDALTLVERGDFLRALPRFQKLGNYENSAQWVTECQYQMAVAAYDNQQFAEAETLFLETSGYKNTAEYLRKIKWQSLFTAIQEKGVDQISASSIEKEYDGKTYIISAIHRLGSSQDLQLEVFRGGNGDIHAFDSLMITLTLDSTVAQFESSNSFGMDYLDGRIGSSQLATGKIDITTCTPETRLVIEAFEKHVEDNLGNITDSTDPADSLMDDDMAANLRDLLTVIPALLAESGITVTLRDIGFYAL